MLATIVKNGKYHIATFHTENNTITCEFEHCQISVRDPDPINVLFMKEYVHDLRFNTSTEVKRRLPETKHLSLREMVEFLNSQNSDPFLKEIDIFN